MMSSGSLKATVKALDNVFSGPAVEVPLSEELQQEIGAFLDKHRDIDDNDSQRIQGGLLNVYEKYVAKDPDKWTAFLRVLTQLRPAITGQVRHERWWTLLIKPVLDGIGHKRSTIEGAKELLLSFLVYDSEDDRGGAKARLSRHFTKEVLGIYLSRTGIVDDDERIIAGEDEFVTEQVETVLVTFGQSKPKDFLVATDRLFTAVEHRVQALSLLCAFLRFQPPHLYIVSETPLIEHLLQCLMNDTSTTAIQLALTVLTMLLPHIPSSLASHLPRLYLVYSRILCWERFGPASSEKHRSESMDENHTFGNTCAANIDPEWAPLHHIFGEIESPTPELLHYFTFMYGLYPLNFMSYIRKPRKYLQNIGFPGAKDFDLDQATIRKRTEQFQQVHILHPNFFNTTIEEELTDNRWVKSDPAEVVAECMGLCVTTLATLDEPGPAPTGRLPDIPERYVRTEDIPSQSLTGNEDDDSVAASGLISPGASKPFSSWRDTQLTARTTSTSSIPRDGSVFDSPTLPPQPADRTDHSSRVQNVPTKDFRSDRNGSVASMPSVDMLSPRLSVYAQNTGPPKILYSSAGGETSRIQTNIAYLQREVILLRNNLNFERWQTKQHLAHIGQRQRKLINEAAVEAEIQDLRSTIRSLKAKLAKGKEAYAMLKKETTAGRNNSRKWEAEQSSKLQELREAQKQWKAEGETLGQELRKVKKDCDQLRRLLVQSEAREMLSQQTLETMMLDLEDLEKLRNKVQELDNKLRDYELKELDFEQATEDQEVLRTELETAKLKLQSSHAERERLKKATERKLADLELQLQTVQASQNQHGRVPSDVQAMLDQALAASHSKVAQLKKAYDRLNHKYGELKLRCHELETEREDGYRSPPYSRRPSRGETNNSIPEESFPFPTPPTGTFSGIMGGPRPSAPFASSVPATYEEHLGQIENESYLLSPSMVKPSASYPGRAVRYDTMHLRRPEPLTPSTERSGMLRSPSPTKTTQSVLSEGLFSSNRSQASLETRSTATSDKSKGKIEPKSDVRVYGRGGAQNIKMKEKEKKEKDKSKSLRSGGLFGNRGIF